MSESNGRLQWRVVDMVTAAILGVACGVIFLVWNQVGGAAYSVIDAATPGFGGLVAGIVNLFGIDPAAAIAAEALVR